MANISNEELLQFNDSLKRSYTRIGNRKITVDTIKVRETVRSHRDASYRFVELHLVMAASQPGYLQPASVVAAAIQIEFEDDNPIKSVYERAKELGAPDAVWLPTLVRDMQSKKSDPMK